MIEFSERLDGPALVAVRGADAPDSDFRLGTREHGWHHHRRGQLFCVDSGLVRLRTPQGSWLLPPNRAGWVPPGLDHRASVSGALSGWNLLLTPEASRALPDHPCVLGLSDLMRALVARAAVWADKDSSSPERDRLIAVLLDEIALAPREALHLPMPTDPRLLRLATRLLAHPDDDRPLTDLARAAGLSERTARRLFLAETQMGFSQWRQQAKLTLALEKLACGEAVADIAESLGYATPSNFIAMFRRALGMSPARYFAQRATPSGNAWSPARTTTRSRRRSAPAPVPG